MKVDIDRSPLGFPHDVHRHKMRHRLPLAWLEARERASALPFDDSQTLGDVFDSAISRVNRAVSRNKLVLRGVPCIRETRIPVYQVCGMIAEGYSIRKTARTFSISDKQVRDALKFASIVLEQ